MRHKPRYNNIELVYVDGDGHEQTFFANDVTSSKYITTQYIFINKYGLYGYFNVYICKIRTYHT